MPVVNFMDMPGTKLVSWQILCCVSFSVPSDRHCITVYPFTQPIIWTVSSSRKLCWRTLSFWKVLGWMWKSSSVVTLAPTAVYSQPCRARKWQSLSRILPCNIQLILTSKLPSHSTQSITCAFVTTSSGMWWWQNWFHFLEYLVEGPWTWRRVYIKEGSQPVNEGAEAIQPGMSKGQSCC